MNDGPGVSVNHARLARENDEKDATIESALPKEDPPKLLIAFHLHSKLSKTILTNAFDSAMHANSIFMAAMSRTNGAVSIEGSINGNRKTTLIVNFSTVAFITIDEVPSDDSDAE